MSANDINMFYDKFIEICSQHFNECYPIRKICLDETKKSKPWISRGLKNTCMKKAIIFEIYLQQNFYK